MTKTYVITSAVIKQKESYLIAKRADTKKFAPSEWEFISGFIDSDGTAEEILLREIQEELHVKGSIKKTLEVFSTTDSEARWIIVPFVVELSTGDIQLNKKDHSEFRWILENEIKQYPELKFWLAHLG